MACLCQHMPTLVPNECCSGWFHREKITCHLVCVCEWDGSAASRHVQPQEAKAWSPAHQLHDNTTPPKIPLNTLTTRAVRRVRGSVNSFSFLASVQLLLGNMGSSCCAHPRAFLPHCALRCGIRASYETGWGPPGRTSRWGTAGDGKKALAGAGPFKLTGCVRPWHILSFPPLAALSTHPGPFPVQA